MRRGVQTTVNMIAMHVLSAPRRPLRRVQNATVNPNRISGNYLCIPAGAAFPDLLAVVQVGLYRDCPRLRASRTENLHPRRLIYVSHSDPCKSEFLRKSFQHVPDDRHVFFAHRLVSRALIYDTIVLLELLPLFGLGRERFRFAPYRLSEIMLSSRGSSSKRRAIILSITSAQSWGAPAAPHRPASGPYRLRPGRESR